MKVLKYPRGFQFFRALWYAGRYWIVTAPSARIVSSPPAVVTCDGVVRTIQTPLFDWEGPSNSERPLRWPHLFTDHSRRKLAVRLSGRDDYVDFDTGEIAKWAVAGNFEAPETDDRAFNDDLVVMSGAEASVNGGVIMGPKIANRLLAIKGLNRGKLVIYRRGGDARVMSVGLDPTNIVLGEDGCTALAAGYRSAVVVDLE